MKALFLTAIALFSASIAHAASVKLTWTDSVGEEKYRIERKIGAATTWTFLTEVAANTTTWSDSGNGFGQFTAGQVYTYRITAQGPTGSSTPVETSVTIPSAPSAPGDFSAVYVP